MAVIAAVHIADEDVTVKRIKWLLMTKTTDDTGAPVTLGAWKDRSVQVVGTFGAGGSLSIYGSNDGSTWAILTDANNAAVTFTSAGLKAITELPYYIRPAVTAGDVTTSLNVWLALQGDSMS